MKIFFLRAFFIVLVTVLSLCACGYLYRISQPKKVIHLSFDDVNVCLQHLATQAYVSPFDEPLFGKMKKMHHLFGAKFTLYVYYKTKNFCLEDVSSKYKKDFEENAHWLKFAYHGAQEGPTFDSIAARKELIEYYEITNNQIIRFAGKKSLTNTIRLDRFYADSLMLSCSYKNGARFFLSADTPGKRSYGLSDIQSLELWNKQSKALNVSQINRAWAIRTDLRLERDDFYQCIKPERMRDTTLVVFAHEWAFNTITQFKLYAFLMMTWLNNYEFYNDLQ